MQSDSEFCTVKHTITFQDILINLYEINFIPPLITIETFQFCVKEFNIEAKIPKIDRYSNIVSSEIWDNYAMPNYVFNNKNRMLIVPISI